jgi:hypothetical protein
MSYKQFSDTVSVEVDKDISTTQWIHRTDLIPATGDIHSSAKGSGARYNNDKTPYEYLPIYLLLQWINEAKSHKKDIINGDLDDMLLSLGKWHNGNDAALDDALLMAIENKLDLSSFGDAARVFKAVSTRAVKPYPAWNWKKGMQWTVPFGCAIRHLLSELSGQKDDEETKLPHRAHLLCNLIMLLEYRYNYVDGDNRPPRL